MSSMTPKPPQSPRVRNLAYAAVAGQAGCLTIIIIIVALLLGLWLDSLVGQRGLFTIGLLLLSIPVSLLAMVRIALGTVKEITPSSAQKAGDRHRDTSHTEEG